VLLMILKQELRSGVILLGDAIASKDEMRAVKRRKLPYEFLSVELQCRGLCGKTLLGTKVEAEKKKRNQVHEEEPRLMSLSEDHETVTGLAPAKVQRTEYTVVGHYLSFMRSQLNEPQSRKKHSIIWLMHLV